MNRRRKAAAAFGWRWVINHPSPQWHWMTNRRAQPIQSGPWKGWYEIGSSEDA